VTNGCRIIHPISENGPTTPGWRGGGGGTDLKRTNFGNEPSRKISTPRLPWADGISPPICPSHLSRRPEAETLAPVKYAQGLPAVDKHRWLWNSGSVGPTRLAQRDVVVGTHTCLSVCTWVWNPPHHCLTLLDQEYTPKYHDDSTRGWALPGRNDLPYVIIQVPKPQVVNSPSDVYAREAPCLP
jgi:hypothetical protein